MSIRVSWSQLRVHGECRQRGHLLRGGHANPAKNIRGYFAGMVVDTAMRHYLANPVPDSMSAGIDALMEQEISTALHSGDGVVRWRSPTDRAEVRALCLDAAARLQPLLDRYVLPYPHRCGYRFRVPVRLPRPDGTLEDVELVGEMDLLVEHPDGPVVYDLKTTRDEQYYRKVIGQLVFYDLAVLAQRHQRTAHTGLIQPLCAQPLLVVHVGDDERRAMWARILGMLTDIWAADMPCTRSTGPCGWCEVSHACPRFGPDSLAGGLYTAASTPPIATEAA